MYSFIMVHKPKRILEHKCDSCRFAFASCPAEKIVFGIDRDPSLRGADADKVLECDAYIAEAMNG